ncbi:hypothetical protein DFQ26_002676 [Actinomortierella ambigua]|nr:hypothetical protein DFQ26_002676 [Actinomortierella ambigua]
MAMSRMSKTHLIVGGLITYAAGVSFAMSFLPGKTPPPAKAAAEGGSGGDGEQAGFPNEAKRRSTFDGLAAGYDSEVNLHEYMLGIQRRRKRLLKQARGRVLEIAAGTGRNVDYYTKGCCDEIVFSDFSDGMLAVLKKKVEESELGKRYDYQLRRQTMLNHEYQQKVRQWEQEHGQVTEDDTIPTSTTPAASVSVSTANASSTMASQQQRPQPPGSVIDTKIRFESMNAASMPYPDQSFDTVVDTFGLCSFEDPVAVLREMKRVLRPGGQILLLEHGNSSWQFMQSMQAKHLERHVDKYGCYWNREIEHVVREAGLTVKESERSQLGTLFYLVAA